MNSQAGVSFTCSREGKADSQVRLHNLKWWNTLRKWAGQDDNDTERGRWEKWCHFGGKGLAILILPQWYYFGLQGEATCLHPYLPKGSPWWILLSIHSTSLDMMSQIRKTPGAHNFWKRTYRMQLLKNSQFSQYDEQSRNVPRSGTRHCAVPPPPAPVEMIKDREQTLPLMRPHIIWDSLKPEDKHQWNQSEKLTISTNQGHQWKREHLYSTKQRQQTVLSWPEKQHISKNIYYTNNKCFS